MTPRRQKVAFYAITAGMVLAVVLVIGEVAVRLFVEDGHVTPELLREQSVKYDSAVFARHVYARSARTVYHKKWKQSGPAAEINRHGYRGPDFEPVKRAGVTRIMIYGGSAVFDSRSTKGLDWPRRVERKLREAGLSEVEVINAGTSGHASVEAVGKLFTEGFTFKPDYVLLYNGWNDLKYFSSDKTVLRLLRPYVGGFDPRVDYKNFLDRWLCEISNLYTVLRRIYYKKTMKIGKEGRRRAKDTQLPITALNPNAFRQYELAMEMFVDLARNIGAEPILMTQARLTHASNTEEELKRIDHFRVGLNHEALVETSDRLDSIVRDVAKRKGARLIDASSHLSGEAWAFDDHVHFLPEGSEALAQFTAEYLRDALGGKAARAPRTLPADSETPTASHSN